MLDNRMLLIKQNTTEEKYYQQMLALLSHMPPYSKLKGKTRFILGWLYFYYQNLKEEFSSKNSEYINALLFDSTTRNKIIDIIIKENEDKDYRDGDAYDKAYNSLANILSYLKKHGFIIMRGGKKHLNPKYILNPKKLIGIKFELNIKGEEK